MVVDAAGAADEGDRELTSLYATANAPIFHTTMRCLAEKLSVAQCCLRRPLIYVNLTCPLVLTLYSYSAGPEAAPSPSVRKRDEDHHASEEAFLD
jgi:hypothetical protein